MVPHDREAAAPDSRAPEAIQTALRGRYEFGAIAGRGGMADVFRARDVRHGRDVAFKILHAWAGEVADAERFAREIRIVASLAHPNVIPLYDSGAVDGTPYYVMPFMPEGSLAQRLAREKPLPVADAIVLGIEIADALEHAHRHGLVHRDVKPQNVLLSGGHAMVADFGLARLLERSAGARATPSSARVGTPLYMSPEQATGGPGVDARADQYALGCVLYEMLAGEPPFTAAQFEGLVYLHRAVEPRPLRERRPEVPAHVAAAVHRALAKMPQDRFATTGELAAALRSMAGREAALSSTAGGSRWPTDPRPFIGRQNELWECMGLLDRARVLTLTGPGGCGKTRLALRLAERASEARQGGAWVVELAGTNDPERVPLRVAETLGVRGTAAGETLASLAKAIGDAPALLVLDNCEHLLDACATLAFELARACPRLSLLATSREPLRIAGEQVYPVPPLGVPPSETRFDRETLLAYDAMRLFLERARIAKPGFDPSASETATIAELCRRLDGLPLAIELAAARLRMLTPAELLARLQDRFRLLKDEDHGTPERHRTLEAAVRWSLDLLSEPERATLHALAVFRGGWSLDAATAICDDEHDEMRMLDALGHLVDRSLVEVLPPADGESRYRLLETVREYAHSRLGETGRLDVIAGRHLDFFLRLAETANERFLSTEQGLWLRRVQRNQENLLAALDRCAALPQAGVQGQQLASALYRHWYTHGLYALGRLELTRALAHPEAQSPTPMRARALFSLAGLAELQGDLAPARAAIEESLAISRSLDDKVGAARALIGLARFESRAGRLDSAKQALESGLAVYREMDEPRGSGYVLLFLAGLAFKQANPDEARRLLEECAQLAAQTGNRALLAYARTNLGVAALQLGALEVAANELQAALRIIEEMDARDAALEALRASAALMSARGRPERAAWLLAATCALHREMNRPEEDLVPGLETATLRHRIEASGISQRERDRAERGGERVPLRDALRQALEWLERRDGPPPVDPRSQGPTEG